MSEQTNYNTQKISCQDASLTFGGISKDKAVISSFEVRARDGRHIFRLDRSGKRKNWTTSISPGNFQVKAGLDNKAGTTLYLEAENGDVVIKSLKGNIRFEAAENIELYARKKHHDGSEYSNGYQRTKYKCRGKVYDENNRKIIFNC